MKSDRVLTCLECGHANPVGQTKCEACGAWVPQTARGRQIASRQPVPSQAYRRPAQPRAYRSASNSDAIVHIVIGVIVIAIAAAAFLAGCPIVWIGGFIWGGIEIVRGLAMFGGAGGGGLP